MAHKEISIVEAVRIVCDRWPVGEKRLGSVIYVKTLHVLREHGSKARPLDSTVLRRLRDVKDGYGIHPVKTSNSIYVKEDPAEWRDKIIHPQRAKA